MAHKKPLAKFEGESAQFKTVPLRLASLPRTGVEACAAICGLGVDHIAICAPTSEALERAWELLMPTTVDLQHAQRVVIISFPGAVTTQRG